MSELGARACVKCGSSEATTREAYRDGLLEDTADVCDGCWADFLDGLARWRQEFGALLDRGISRAEANRLIIARMDAGEKP